jgi:hypothetical protein
MAMKMEWIPDPDAWRNVGGERTSDSAINRLNYVIEAITGKSLSNGEEITLHHKDLQGFKGAYAAGLNCAGTIAKALQEHSSIRVRYTVE